MPLLLHTRSRGMQSGGEVAPQRFLQVHAKVDQSCVISATAYDGSVGVRVNLCSVVVEDNETNHISNRRQCIEDIYDGGTHFQMTSSCVYASGCVC